MRIELSVPTEKEWEDFFVGDQVGGKLKAFEGIRYQRGYGLGNFFGGIIRTLLPFIKLAGKKVGRQALKTGTDIATDVIAGKNVKRAIEEHGKAGVKRLATKGIRKLQMIATDDDDDKDDEENQKGRGFGLRPRKCTARGTMKAVKAVTTKKRKKKHKIEDQLGFYYPS